MKDISRRVLVRTAAVGVVLAPVATARTALAATTNLYARNRFTSLIGSSFDLDETGTTLWLSEISDLVGAPRNDKDRYRLTFRTTTAGPAQGSYTLRRPGFTATPLFVVPSDAGRLTYEAVIYRAF